MFDIVLVCAIIVAAFVLFASEKIRVDLVAMMMLAALALLGQLRPGAQLDASRPAPPSSPGDDELVIARTESVATVHRAARMTSLAIRPTVDGGSVEHRFIVEFGRCPVGGADDFFEAGGTDVIADDGVDDDQP